VQLGFVIDHSRCIGCHACTVACKSENDVPLGDFRTWVKYTEEGDFPAVKRSFAVLRCNQCTDAPCVTICPVTALDKGANGIVDVDSSVCIGCKSCMHGCPYDALYINEQTGTAEKCHFCAHRVEMDLAPACAVVCPTEAIIPGDFDDPESVVSRMKATGELSARKTEAGTNPNVMYREVADAGIDPNSTNLATGAIWSDNPRGAQYEAQAFELLEQKAAAAESARTVYDVPRKQLWGSKISGYLWAKSLAAGIFPVAFLANGAEGVVPALASIVFLAITSLLLVLDLKRRDRFYLILIRPNWDSWLARGTYVLVGYGALLGLWVLLQLSGLEVSPTLSGALGLLTTGFGLMSAAYTGWLFTQAKGRVLWMKRHYWAHLLLQALLAGGAFLLLIGQGADSAIRELTALGIGGHLAMMLLEHSLAPRGREKEYARAARLVTHGPFSRVHWSLGVLVGAVLPLGIVLGVPGLWLAALAGVMALVGLWFEEETFVRAGQALPIS